MPENKIQPQLQKLWNVVSKEETRKTYTETISVTAEIVKETAVLAWYLILLVLVGSDALVMFGRKTLHNVRQLANGLDNSKSMNDIATDTGKALATAGQGAVSSLLSQARTQLGLPERTALELPSMPQKIAEPEPVPVAAPPPEPVAAAVEPPAATPVPTAEAHTPPSADASPVEDEAPDVSAESTDGNSDEAS